MFQLNEHHRRLLHSNKIEQVEGYELHSYDFTAATFKLERLELYRRLEEDAERARLGKTVQTEQPKQEEDNVTSESGRIWQSLRRGDEGVLRILQAVSGRDAGNLEEKRKNRKRGETDTERGEGIRTDTTSGVRPRGGDGALEANREDIPSGGGAGDRQIALDAESRAVATGRSEIRTRTENAYRTASLIALGESARVREKRESLRQSLLERLSAARLQAERTGQYVCPRRIRVREKSA